MSLIVEDGTGLPNAESYCSVAYADARQTANDQTLWLTLTTAQKEASLRRATQYMLAAYRQRWTGYRVKIAPTMQALDWPRYGVEVDHFPVHYDIVPTDIQNACADLALKAAAGDLAPDLSQGVIREKVGPIETEYNRGSPQYTRYRAIDMMLAPYLTGGSSRAVLVRS